MEDEENNEPVSISELKRKFFQTGEESVEDTLSNSIYERCRNVTSNYFSDALKLVSDDISDARGIWLNTSELLFNLKKLALFKNLGLDDSKFSQVFINLFNRIEPVTYTKEVFLDRSAKNLRALKQKCGNIDPSLFICERKFFRNILGAKMKCIGKSRNLKRKPIIPPENRREDLRSKQRKTRKVPKVNELESNKAQNSLKTSNLSSESAPDSMRDSNNPPRDDTFRIVPDSVGPASNHLRRPFKLRVGLVKDGGNSSVSNINSNNASARPVAHIEPRLAVAGPSRSAINFQRDPHRFNAGSSNASYCQINNDPINNPQPCSSRFEENAKFQQCVSSYFDEDSEGEPSDDNEEQVDDNHVGYQSVEEEQEEIYDAEASRHNFNQEQLVQFNPMTVDQMLQIRNHQPPWFNDFMERYENISRMRLNAMHAMRNEIMALENRRIRLARELFRNQNRSR